MLVQTLVPKPAVEALDEGISGRLAGLDELQADLALVRPLIEHVAPELGPVVTANLPGKAPRGPDALENGDHAVAGQAAIRFEDGTVRGDVLDEGARPNAAPVGQRIAHKIHAPALIGRGGERQRLAFDRGTLPLSTTDDQAYRLLGSTGSSIVSSAGRAMP